MIGIDIIDLSDPLLNERSDRSLKLISNHKDRTINHPHLFWLLWTAKEAVFKARRKPAVFAPKEIPIKLKRTDGRITFISDNLVGSFEVFDSHIIAITNHLKEQVVLKVFNKETTDWSSQIRKKLTEHLQAIEIGLTLTSDENDLPILIPGNIPVSITHHGRFGGFVYPKTTH